MADSEVVRPQDILDGDLREQLKRAVISAYMATSVIGEADGHSIKRFVNMEEDGSSLRYNYDASILGENYPVYIKYPSGEWSLNVRPGPDIGDYPGFTAISCTGRWSELEGEVDAWLDAWVDTAVNPNEFENQINSMARIASQLNIGGNQTGGGPPGGDTDLREAVKTISNRAYGKGAAMVAFRDAYSSDLWTTINNQCGMAMAAGLALTAEGAAWSEANKTLRDLIQVSINDFYSLADSNGSADDGSTLAATSAVAGILGATVGLVFPPFGAAMGGLGAVIGVYTVMRPAVPAVDESALTLSGSDYPAMWSSFQTQVRRIATDLANAERGIADGCRAVLTDLNGNPESYSLSRNTKKGRQYDDFDAALGQEIDLPDNLLRQMSGAAEVIGDQQRTLGGFVLGEDGQGNPSAKVADEWYRGTLPDGTRIGMESDGPYASFVKLVDALGALLKAEGDNSHRMAEALMRTALDFARTDDLSRAELHRLNKEIDAEAGLQDHNPLVRGNTDDDPWYAEHGQ